LDWQGVTSDTSVTLENAMTVPKRKEEAIEKTTPKRPLTLDENAG